MKPAFDELFEAPLIYPDPDTKERFEALAGLEAHKSQLIKTLGLLVNKQGLKKWAKEYHPEAAKLVSLMQRRPPLIVLEGDVGCGKSELAYTLPDAVARQERIDITLFPLSLATRGQGRVGEMTQLISAAFDYTIEKAKALKGDTKAHGAVILLIDEADALAQTRENTQMHHEDKAGVNAFIRGIDNIANSKLPAAVIMCTNRLGSLDPAIKRRAAEILHFERPDEVQRLAVLEPTLTELGFAPKEVKTIVSLTGPTDDRDYGFTFSDLTQRLLPSIVLDAYPENAVLFDRAAKLTKTIIPTSPFKEK